MSLIRNALTFNYTNQVWSKHLKLYQKLQLDWSPIINLSNNYILFATIDIYPSISDFYINFTEISIYV